VIVTVGVTIPVVGATVVARLPRGFALVVALRVVAVGVAVPVVVATVVAVLWGDLLALLRGLARLPRLARGVALRFGVAALLPGVLPRAPRLPWLVAVYLRNTRLARRR
jgi:hypothetical protein